MLESAQIVQIVGAAAILAGFGLSQFKLARTDDFSYLLLNLIGGALLLVSAVAEQQWGFVVLEIAWTLLSGWGLLGKVRAPSPAV
jgi:hypothetical protein